MAFQCRRGWEAITFKKEAGMAHKGCLRHLPKHLAKEREKESKTKKRERVRKSMKIFEYKHLEILSLILSRRGDYYKQRQILKSSTDETF